MVLHRRVSTVPGEGSSASLVIFTRVEGLLRAETHTALVEAGGPLRFLASHGVPLVLVSAWGAVEIRQLQNEFALDQPFICEEGAALHVPQAWLSGPAPAKGRVDDDWEVFRFSPASIAAAFQLVSAMFLARGFDPLLTVGIGCDLADYTLLEAVDIPIVIRGSHSRQPELLRRLPGAYVTGATGTAGWSEAVLGGAPIRQSVLQELR